MQFPPEIQQQSCHDCLSGADLGFEIRMAFQPIIEWTSQSIVGYEVEHRTSTILTKPAESKR